MQRNKNRTIIIGITGSLGTGKTTAAKIFKSLGAKVLDADKIAHGTFRKNTTSYRRIIKAFGRGILNKSQKIDRAKLAHLVFRNKKSLSKLCDIVHSIVIGKIKYSIEAISNPGNVSVLVIDAPLLIEAGLHEMVDYLIVVKTSRATQIKRVTKKTGFGSDEIIRRIKSQIPLSKKIHIADYIIDNEGSVKDTERTIKKIWKEIKNNCKLSGRR